MGQVQRTVHVPLCSDTKRALGLPCQPASCQGGPCSVELLQAAERDVRQPHRNTVCAWVLDSRIWIETCGWVPYI
jgi:hypothetical protein